MFPRIKTFGNSMFPFFQDGDVIFVKKSNFSQIKVNDFITVKKNNRFITHRVIYKSPTYLITKGDNNLKHDGKIYPRDILGIVEKVKRKNQVFNPENIFLFQSTYYFAEIVKVKNEFEKNNVDFVILKGLPLHLYFEKTHPKRLYFDCDFLVNRNDLVKAQKILKKLNFRKAKTTLSKIHDLLKRNPRELAYYKSSKNGFPVNLDLHTQAVSLMQQVDNLDPLYPAISIEKMTKQFLRQKRQIDILGEKFPILNEENLICYLATHIFHHNYKGYFRYDFLDKIIKKNQNLKKVIEKIKNYQLENFSYPVFLFLKKYYRTPISDQLLNKIKPTGSVYRYLKQNILKLDIFEDEDRLHGGINRFKHLFYLSPNPIYKKILIFFDPQVLYSILWSLKKRLFIRR